MDLDKLSYLPEWNERLLHMDDNGEEWKIRPAIEAAKALYQQWREVFDLAIAIADSLTETARMNDEDGIKRLMYENIMIVGAKIMSAAGGTLYIIKMENAAIIRVNCRQLMDQIGFAVMTGMADERHQQVIRQEMDKFRTLFRQWVVTFQKDAYEDEWGLFV